MPAKGEAVFFTAKDYDSAIRKVKTSAKSNFSTYLKATTMFYNGVAVGWAVLIDGTMVYLDKHDMEHLGLIAKRK